jgi:hypothetical protein
MLQIYQRRVHAKPVYELLLLGEQSCTLAFAVVRAPSFPR